MTILSMLASEFEATGADTDLDRAISIRFAAAAVFLFAVFAAIASRGARRPWAGRGRWPRDPPGAPRHWRRDHDHRRRLASPDFLGGFGAAVAVMLVLSTSAVRRDLGQESSCGGCSSANRAQKRPMIPENTAPIAHTTNAIIQPGSRRSSESPAIRCASSGLAARAIA